MCIAPAVAFMCGAALAASPAAPTFQELMDPTMFPEAQRGMEVESVGVDGGVFTIRTTGAAMEVEAREGRVVLRQRIGHQRRLAVLESGRPWRGGKVTHRGPGFARLAFEEPALTVRINGDSLFMLHVREPLEVNVKRSIEVAWHASFDVHHLLADEWGAFGLYCSDEAANDHFGPYAETVAQYALPEDQVLWVAVCPPKPYDWERSLTDHVVWHWSPTEGYPSDDALRSWRTHGNIVLLQSEIALWKDWNLDFVPRRGPEEFARVRDTIHGLGMRFEVYTSPFFFLKGTASEHFAFDSWERPSEVPLDAWTCRGENMELFMQAIQRVMNELQPDGLYFDGQYFYDPAALYALARRSREVVGEDGILEWHSTFALGMGECYLPQADAYVDYILRGEGRQTVSFDHLRYFVSGHNISNSVGVLCNNVSMPVTPELVADVLRANARLHTRFEWLDDPAVVRTLEGHYFAALTPDLRRAVEAQVDERQADAKAAATRAEEADRALRAPPQWGEPAFAVEFDEMPAAGKAVSPANTEPFSIIDGCLQIRAHAHTHAYLRVPVGVAAEGFEVKIRQGTDLGMHWGPSVLLRWENGAGLRVGTRSDGFVQVNVHPTETLAGRIDPTEWLWLRARWSAREAVIEVSTDGEAFEAEHRFTHVGELTGSLAELLIGKMPGDGALRDHPVPGDTGECRIDFVRLYGE